MRSMPWSTSFALAFLLAAASAQAQQNAPHVGYVYPAGGRQGETFQVTIGGQRLGRPTNVAISGRGVQAKIVDYTKPLTSKQVQDLREKRDVLRKKPKDPDAVKEMAQIRKQLDEIQERRVNPALADKVVLQVTLASDADLGRRELRLTTEGGLSNPVVFDVGQLAEFSQPHAKPSHEPIRKQLKDPKASPRTKPEPEMSITLPATVNGQITPGGVDHYRFQARKGQRLVVAVSARELIPYLADAVPGWFQAAVAIYDTNGNELAYDDHYRFHPDPVLFCRIPKDGQYVMEIRDSIYRGREDFVYRIAIGELPFVTGISPLGASAGTQAVVELKGWNLPNNKLTVDVVDHGDGILPLLAHKGRLVSNPAPFAVDRLPECSEKEPNDEPATAQPVKLPIIINGRIDKPGDWDVFRIEGRAGQTIVADVDARKLDSPLDSVLRLTDASGKQLALNDDFGDKGTGLSTHHADSWLTAKLPADGAYYVHVSDAQHRGGPEYGYRLRISEPRPDFALRIVPSSITVRAGTSAPMTVYALRKDGFSGEIALILKDAPKGSALGGARVPAGQEQTKVTLTAPQAALKEPVSLRIEGRAKINGQEVVHAAVPADDMMQAFIYRHLVPAKELLVTVKERARLMAPWKLLVEGVVKLPVGGNVAVPFTLTRGPLADQVRLTLHEAPDGISIQNTSLVGQNATVTLHADAAKAKPGLKGNLIIDASVERTQKAKDGRQKPGKRWVPLGSLPAIPFEIVKPP